MARGESEAARADGSLYPSGTDIPAPPPPPANLQRARTLPSLGALSALGVPPGLARLAHDEASRVGLRLFLLDNSGSTNAPDGHELREFRLITCTRWREVCATAENACRLGAATGVPCEFHLLNPLRGHGATSATGGIEGEDFIATSSLADLPRLQAFLSRVNPSGVTPLAERLRALRPRFAAFVNNEAASGRVAFLVLCTDGAPTPLNSGTPTTAAAQAALFGLKQLTSTFPVRLVVRLCTDEDSAVNFWNEADAEEELALDVLDDYNGEAKEVYAKGNGWLAYSPALHMLRESGTLIGLLDLLDERRLSAGESAVLAGLLLDGGSDPLPDWKLDYEHFASDLTRRAAAAGSAFDGRCRRSVPLVDAPALLRIVRSGQGGALSILLAYKELVAIALVLMFGFFYPGWASQLSE